uniref:AlNc14C148G7453 protein n=1 Tax=Albugo laibachii Nc14 TaxID=890382 RepID=F0WLT4_9STRA|nr:AlNc14C148G7453 [Albugo laibachii Nc14]|eukprot:CCA22260.1 AlNc14C148G7453 [Albugo laibachii Nc14]
MQEINRRCRMMKNNLPPDFEALFAEKVRMDLKEDDRQHVMGHTKANDHDAIVQTKNSTKILIDNLAPTMLKREIMRLVALEYRKAKADEGALYNLILDCAREQHHYFLIRIRDKPKQTTQNKAPISRTSHTQFIHHSRSLLLDLPPDTHVTTTLRHPVSVEVVGGATLVCRERVTLDVQLRTAAGPVNIMGNECLVLDEEEDIFILAKGVLSSLGIDVGAMIAKLAEGAATDTDGDDLTTHLAVELGVDVDSDILNLLSSWEHAALLEEDEDCGLAHELYELAVQHRDIWRNQLDYDPPAVVETLLMKFQVDAKPVTSKARPYPQQKSDYLRSYFTELEWLVRKGLNTNEFRTTVDYTGANNLVIPLAEAMPDMKTATTRVSGAKYYARFDNSKGFCQLALHLDYQDQFSIVTEDGVLRKGVCCGFRRAYTPETPDPVVPKHPPPQAPVFTKQLSLGGIQGRQAHSMHVNFFNTLLNLPPSARIQHKGTQRNGCEWKSLLANDLRELNWLLLVAITFPLGVDRISSHSYKIAPFGSYSPHNVVPSSTNSFFELTSAQSEQLECVSCLLQYSDYFCSHCSFSYFWIRQSRSHILDVCLETDCLSLVFGLLQSKAYDIYTQTNTNHPACHECLVRAVGVRQIRLLESNEKYGLYWLEGHLNILNMLKFWCAKKHLNITTRMIFYKVIVNIFRTQANRIHCPTPLCWILVLRRHSILWRLEEQSIDQFTFRLVRKLRGAFQRLVLLPVIWAIRSLHGVKMAPDGSTLTGTRLSTLFKTIGKRHDEDQLFVHQSMGITKLFVSSANWAKSAMKSSPTSSN